MMQYLVEQLLNVDVALHIPTALSDTCQSEMLVTLHPRSAEMNRVDLVQTMTNLFSYVNLAFFQTYNATG